MRYHHLLPNIHVIACDYLCRRINVEYSINNGIIYIITLCELLCCEENCGQEGVCFGPVLAVPLYFMLGERRVDYGPTGNEFLMLAKSLIQFRDNNANNFNIPHDFNLNFQTIESPPPSPLWGRWWWWWSERDATAPTDQRIRCRRSKVQPTEKIYKVLIKYTFLLSIFPSSFVVFGVPSATRWF